ncbi:GNAT family N-acetyltransferase [Aerococcaceae bacterium WGS1372]
MIKYLSRGQVTVEELRNLYQSVGWTSYTQDLTILAKTLEGSRHYIIARTEGRLVGLVRSVGDGVFIAYIQDLLVHPDYHRQGIGTQLMEQVF